MAFLAAALQLGPASPTVAGTTRRIVDLIGKAGEMGVKLGVLPELALTPYFAAAIHEDVARFASPGENAAAMEEIAAAARAAGLSLSVSLAEIERGKLFNSMAFLDESGRRIGMFRKIHIPGEAKPKEDGSFTIMEKRYFAPGDLGFGVFETPVAKVGGLICYDRRFPESYRSLGLNGAEVICVAYNTPVSPSQPGATLAKGRRASELAMRAGAYFTGSYVIGAGKAGRENGVRYIGGSLVIGPDGEILKRASGNGDEVVAAEIDLAKVAAIRGHWKYDINRRPDVYVMRLPEPEAKATAA